MRIGQAAASNVGEYIRAAERHIASGDYNVALNELVTARNLQPNNAYIDAIFERIQVLQREKQRSSSGAGHAASAEPAPEQVRAEIRRLTSVAHGLYERGSFERAFDSLMDAYLLDPMSPDVLSCEKDLLPAWELLRKTTRKPAPIREPARPAATPPGGSPPLTKSESGRLELLKQQKEFERLERERAMWREASMPPHVALKADSGRSSEQLSPDGEEKPSRRFIQKFKFGRRAG